MDGINAKFISNTAGFLEYNVLTVISPADTRFQDRNTKLAVHDMDLVKSPLIPTAGVSGAVDLAFYTAPAPAPAPSIASQVGATLSSLFSSEPAKKQSGDARLRAYWLPWSPDTIAELDLTDGTVDFFFTAGFSGCSFTVSGNSRSPHVCHSNMVSSTYMPLANVQDVGGQPTMQNRKADLKGFEIPDIYGTQEGGKQHTKAIGQKLADARNARNMSQLDFSAASGLSVADVSTAEVGGFPIDRMNAIADTYARVLGVSAGPLKAAGPMVRMLSREDKYKRVYLGQQLKAKVKAMQTGVQDDVFGMMSFDHDYGHGQDDAHGRSAQASVCGYRNSNGNWRFISQYHIVNLTASPKTIALVSSQCVVCKNTPQKCVCPG